MLPPNGVCSVGYWIEVELLFWTENPVRLGNQQMRFPLDLGHPDCVTWRIVFNFFAQYPTLGSCNTLT